MVSSAIGLIRARTCFRIYVCVFNQNQVMIIQSIDRSFDSNSDMYFNVNDLKINKTNNMNARNFNWKYKNGNVPLEVARGTRTQMPLIIARTFSFTLGPTKILLIVFFDWLKIEISQSVIYFDRNWIRTAFNFVHLTLNKVCFFLFFEFKYKILAK